MGEVVEQARRLISAGYIEIVLTGVDLTSYGADLPGAPKLGTLTKALLDHVLAQTGGVLALKCQAANLGAQAFYDREGFICIEAGEDDGVKWLRYVRG